MQTSIAGNSENCRLTIVDCRLQASDRSGQLSPLSRRGRETGGEGARPGADHAYRPHDQSTIDNRQSSIGFTLVELLVVLVLVGMLVAVVFPSIGRGLSTLRLKTCSREIAATLRLARSKAVREQQVYLVGFNLEKNEVELSSADLRYQKFFLLPAGVSIKRAVVLKAEDRTDRTHQYYFFSPNGMTEAFEILIGNDRGRQLKVVQDSLSQSPRIEDIL